MLLNWQSHQEYCHFLHEAKVHFDHSQRSRLTGEFAAAREKLRLLNSDPVMKLLQPCYPPLGRPAINQAQILRSLILMLHQGCVSIATWVEKLRSDSLPAFLIGCTPHSLPPPGSYYDFIDRLWLQDEQFYKSGRKECFPADKNRKPSIKPGKGKKLPNRHPEITKIMANAAVSRDAFPFYYEKLLHEAFRVAAILPSIQRGLINKDGITLSGDGPASIPMPALTGIKYAAAPFIKKNAVTVRGIFPIRMRTGDGTVTLELTILAIRCICCLTMTAGLAWIFLYTSVSWMPDAMTVSAALSHSKNFAF